MKNSQKILEESQQHIIDRDKLDLNQFRHWIISSQLPRLAIEYFKYNIIKSLTTINNITFHSNPRIFKENSHSDNSQILEAGYIIIGTGLNGDPILLDFQTYPGSIAYLCLDEYYDDEENIFELVQYIEPDFETFITNVSMQKDYPSDFYEAQDYSLTE